MLIALRSVLYSKCYMNSCCNILIVQSYVSELLPEWARSFVTGWLSWSKLVQWSCVVGSWEWPTTTLRRGDLSQRGSALSDCHGCPVAFWWPTDPACNGDQQAEATIFEPFTKRIREECDLVILLCVHCVISGYCKQWNCKLNHFVEENGHICSS